MKGPGLRNDLEIRRTWKCPLCGRIAKYLGHIVAATCNCTNQTIQMQLQPDVRKAPPKFEKVVIPLTEEDLVIRDRPRRMPEPAEPGFETDRRPQRPKRPKPERRSFESFQEQLGTAEPKGDSLNAEPIELAGELPGEVGQGIQGELADASQAPSGSSGPTQSDSAPTEDDQFGEGLA